MKHFFYIGIIAFCGCSESGEANKKLETRIDSLEQKLANTYKPGFGEFMSNIQMHHARLWFAGENKNWNLAEFEAHEITEALDAIRQFQTEREESKKVEIMKPALDSMTLAVQQQNVVAFKNSFVLLTATCNNCHRATDFGFNVVRIPLTHPFSNQSFEIMDSLKK